MRTDELRQLVGIAKMYYLDQLSQNEIAERLFISRSQISKLLARARKHNIVTIHINDPFAQEHEVAEALIKRYRLDNAVVVDTGGKSDDEAMATVAQAASLAFTSCIANGNLVGISAGLTCATCARHLTIYNCRNLTFVPLIGGQSFEGESWYANNNCQLLASRMQQHYLVLNSPMVMRNEHARRELCDDESIRPVLDCYNRLDAILLGVGQVAHDATLARCPFSAEEIDWCLERGAKAIIGASFIDAGGNETLREKTDLFVGVKASHIRQCKSVVTIALGEKKLDAIQAVLKGGYTRTLCTDLNTARKLAE